MLLIRSLLLGILALILLPLSMLAAPVTRTAGDRYEITAQYISEPAILGDTNGVRVTITENGEVVTGVASDLTVQVEFMEAVRILNMYEDSARPGVYNGTFIPMQEGEYTFNISGTLDGVEINETFTVADGLVKVTPRSDYEFPNAAHGFEIQHLAVPVAATALIGLAVLFVNKRNHISPR